MAYRSLPSRGAWIEICLISCEFCNLPSLPSRGAWIEITRCSAAPMAMPTVAPLAGSVDRNLVTGLELVQVVQRRSPRGERG